MHLWAAGRKSSASGTLSVREALRVMSIETVVAAKEKSHPLIQKVNNPFLPGWGVLSLEMSSKLLLCSP